MEVQRKKPKGYPHIMTSFALKESTLSGDMIPPKAVWLFTLSALGGSYHIWRVCLFCCGIRRKSVEGTEVIIGDLRGVFFRNAMPSATLGKR